jgi:mannosyltransferase
MALSLLLRLPNLEGKSLWLDEISSLTFAGMDWHNFWALVQQHEGNMLAYYLLLRAWVHIGDSQAVAKLLSIIFGVATVPAMYALGKELYGHRIGLISALLLTVSACHVRASQWIRSYSLMLLMLVLSSWFLARVLERPTLRNCTLYVLTSALAVYNHFYAVLVLGTQVISVLLLAPRTSVWGRMVLSWLTLSLLLLPAAGYVLFRNTGQLDWILPPQPRELLHWAVFLAGAGGTGVAYALLAICLLLCIIAFTAVRRSWRIPTRSLENWRLAFPFFWLIVPVAAAFLVSYAKPIFFFRYLIVCLPAFVLIIAQGIASWQPSLLRTTTLVIALCLSLVTVVLAYKTEEDWAGSMHYLLTRVQPGEPVFAGTGIGPLQYYSKRWYGTSKHFGLPDYTLAESDPTSLAHTQPRIWVVVFPNFHPEPRTVALLQALAPAYQVKEEKKFKAITVELLEAIPAVK